MGREEKEDRGSQVEVEKGGRLIHFYFRMVFTF